MLIVLRATEKISHSICGIPKKCSLPILSDFPREAGRNPRKWTPVDDRRSQWNV